MFIKQLTTDKPEVKLIEPDVDRDAPLGVYWLADPHGRYTLKMMGVPDKDNRPSTLAEETQRMHQFIENKDQYNWMIEDSNQVIGTIWVDLLPAHGQQSPSLSIMLGDPEVRGGGIGYSVSLSVIDYLRSLKYSTLHSRHLVENLASKSLLEKLRFTNDGQSYFDEDGLHWQNVKLILETK